MNIPPRITREFIRSLRNTHVFIYGDTRELDGHGGQASVARGEPNAYPVMVKYKKCVNDPISFVSDNYLTENLAVFHRQLAHVPRNKPIIVFPKIGLGWNQMDIKAPTSYDKLRELIREYCAGRIVNEEVL